MKADPPKMNVGKVTQVLDGKPVRMYYRKDGSSYQYIICCDCGLTHREIFTPKKGYLKVTAWRDDETTKRFRRKREQRLVSRYQKGLPSGASRLTQRRGHGVRPRSK